MSFHFLLVALVTTTLLFRLNDFVIGGLVRYAAPLLAMHHIVLLACFKSWYDDRNRSFSQCNIFQSCVAGTRGKEVFIWINWRLMKQEPLSLTCFVHCWMLGILTTLLILLSRIHFALATRCCVDFPVANLTTSLVPQPGDKQTATATTTPHCGLCFLPDFA